MMEQSFKAKYQVNKNLFVACYLDVVEATQQGFKAQVGIRSPGDIILPVGTKLYLASVPSLQPHLKSNAFETYYVVVEGVEVDYGVAIQSCSPILKEKRKNLRRFDRKETSFDAHISEIAGTNFSVLNGSSDGLALQYKASSLLVGLVLGNRYTFNASYKDHLLSIPAKALHLHYDWKNNQHTLGLKILQLNTDQEFLLNRLLDPNYTDDTSQNASIDTEEARIRAD